MALALNELEGRLKSAWSVETATTWTRDNPALGQCSVTALVVNDLLGGRILKTRVGPNYHFYNLIDDTRIDLTSSQFGGQIAYEDLPASRDDAFGDTTFKQYQALRRALFLETHSAGCCSFPTPG
ncbi:YunG family protein [Brevundimonas sp. TSRC1-1]|uniref:YunG family protein n=1 Tax=Brevundimonas sp. TSRC1-1 TaxID=2804562 RepID=UPI003CFAD256